MCTFATMYGKSLEKKLFTQKTSHHFCVESNATHRQNGAFLIINTSSIHVKFTIQAKLITQNFRTISLKRR